MFWNNHEREVKAPAEVAGGGGNAGQSPEAATSAVTPAPIEVPTVTAAPTAEAPTDSLVMPPITPDTGASVTPAAPDPLFSTPALTAEVQEASVPSSLLDKGPLDAVAAAPGKNPADGLMETIKSGNDVKEPFFSSDEIAALREAKPALDPLGSFLNSLTPQTLEDTKRAFRILMSKVEESTSGTQGESRTGLEDKIKQAYEPNALGKAGTLASMGGLSSSEPSAPSGGDTSGGAPTGGTPTVM